MMDTSLTPPQIRTLTDVVSRFPAVNKVLLEYIDADWRLVKLIEGFDTEVDSFELDGEGTVHPVQVDA